MTSDHDVARAIAFFEACEERELLQEVLRGIRPRASAEVRRLTSRGEGVPPPRELNAAPEALTQQQALETVNDTTDFGQLQALARAIRAEWEEGWKLARKAKKRQKKIQLGLADALDLMVVSVEAGLGLDQAILRVGDELRFAHPDLSDELRLVNIELRAGKARTDALRNLADRTGLDDLVSLTTMLIQTDKFGTSVAQSLRVFSETLRTKRRQRAEEAAAKTGVKMVFPLVLCIFPAIWVVTIGPAAIKFVEVLFPIAQNIKK